MVVVATSSGRGPIITHALFGSDASPALAGSRACQAVSRTGSRSSCEDCVCELGHDIVRAGLTGHRAAPLQQALVP